MEVHGPAIRSYNPERVIPIFQLKVVCLRSDLIGCLAEMTKFQIKIGCVFNFLP